MKIINNPEYRDAPYMLDFMGGGIDGIIRHRFKTAMPPEIWDGKDPVAFSRWVVENSIPPYVEKPEESNA